MASAHSVIGESCVNPLHKCRCHSTDDREGRAKRLAMLRSVDVLVTVIYTLNTQCNLKKPRIQPVPPRSLWVGMSYRVRILIGCPTLWNKSTIIPSTTVIQRPYGLGLTVVRRRPKTGQLNPPCSSLVPTQTVQTRSWFTSHISTCSISFFVTLSKSIVSRSGDITKMRSDK